MLDIGLVDVQDAAGYAGLDGLLLKLDPLGADALAGHQRGQEAAVAAAEVQHAGAGLDEVEDGLVLGREGAPLPHLGRTLYVGQCRHVSRCRWQGMS